MAAKQTNQRRPASPGGTFFKRLLAQTHVAIYRASRGSIGHRMGASTALLLTTTGRKTGKPRVAPLAYFRDGDRFILIASNYGAATDPIWWRNLRAHPDATIQVGSQAMRVRATAATGEERARLAGLATQRNLTYERYQRGTTRDIPLIILQPVS